MSYKRGKPKRKVRKPAFLSDKYEVKSEKNGNAGLYNSETGEFIRMLTANDYKLMKKWESSKSTSKR